MCVLSKAIHRLGSNNSGCKILTRHQGKSRRLGREARGSRDIARFGRAYSAVTTVHPRARTARIRSSPFLVLHVRLSVCLLRS